MCSPDVNVQEQDTPSSTMLGTSLYYILNMFILLFTYCHSLSFKPFTPHTKLLYHYVCPRLEDPSSLTGNSFHIPDLPSGLILIFFNFFVVIFNDL